MAKALTVYNLELIKPGSIRREIPHGLIRGLYFVMQPAGKPNWAARSRAWWQSIIDRAMRPRSATPLRHGADMSRRLRAESQRQM